MAIKTIIQDAPLKEIEEARKMLEKRNVKPFENKKIEKRNIPIEKQIKETPKIEPTQPIEEIDQEKIIFSKPK